MLDIWGLFFLFANLLGYIETQEEGQADSQDCQPVQTYHASLHDDCASCGEKC